MHASVAPRCINHTLGVQYHTTYQTVSTLRYEVLELLKLLLQIVTRESDQHIWLVATSLNFLKYNDFYCTLVFVADPHWRPMQFPWVREGPQLHWQHFRTVAPQQTQVRTRAPNQKSQQLKFVNWILKCYSYIFSSKVPKSHAAVDYTLTGVEPHGPTRSVWPIVAPANRSQSYRN